MNSQNKSSGKCDSEKKDLQIRVPYIDFNAQYNEIKEEILKEITCVLEKGSFVLGKELVKFEKNFASYTGTKYALGVANGTDALFLVMKALDIGKGDEVITVPNTFIATAGAIVAAGAKPVFVDVKNDFNINPELIDNVVTKNTKAIIPVHLTGRVADMDSILEIAKKHKLHVIEDAAQSVGARYKGKRAGSFGIAAGFSLHPLKNLNAAGDAGLVTTNSGELHEKLVLLRNHGLKNRDECACWGYNSRLDCLQAVIANVKLKHLDKWTEKIREIANIYKDGLKSFVGKGIISVPVDHPFEEPVYHTFIIQCEKRDELQAFLFEKGIKTKIHYPIPIHLHEAASGLGYKKGDFPVAEQQAKIILSLPIYPEMSDEQVAIVIDEIKSFYGRFTLS
ncbi:MAG: DegT/DnrJ/EryC1/StrS family aminotransferase [Nanoarchaeota archaeon]|nr:DegT/DnrJ/EryC1/StrS family aminotransferase [Nanoarchaeota archaeon]MBU1320876.1 DegT/DnrJ/EryC1/StrS family aminotransferase [Nanoarchaeota archaeon]MBU1597782.1 DegT/DnrJ/EryC1/StrS family aminotransferase [Nanoarchaeota archaeon]MBU2441233.1 DegT/DnrJ/EryC1/StrS family aminotransferase [Nanoarchaeota archaeon]